MGLDLVSLLVVAGPYNLLQYTTFGLVLAYP